MNSKIERIVTRDNRVCGMDIHGQGRVEVDAIISTVSGMLTFGLLLNSGDVPYSMKKKMRKPPLSHRAFVVQLGLSNRVNARSHSHCVLPMMEEQDKFFASEKNEFKWLAYSVPTVTMPELAPLGGSIIEMYPSINQNIPPDAWDDKRKETILESAINALSRIHHIDIAVKRAICPKDFQSKLHLYNGSIYGLSPVAGPGAQFPHNPPIRGLYQAGQTTHPGCGVGPAAMSGILAAEALIKNENV